MPRTCTICTNEHRPEIDRDLVTGASFRIIAERWSVTKSALYRHKQEHLPGHLVKAHEEESIGQAIDVVRQLKAINAACLEILQSSRADKKHSISLGAVDRIHRQIELQAKLLGELQDNGPQVNILVAPQWQEIRVNVLQALGPFPEARTAVARVLGEVSNGR
jgi:hypothetical protein